MGANGLAMYMQLGILAHVRYSVQEPYNKVHTRLVDGRRHPRRVHFSSQAHLHRAQFLTAPATAAGAMHTFRHGSVPTVRTKRQIPYTAGGLPCRKVHMARPVFAVYTFQTKAVPTEYTSHTAIYSCVGAPLSAKKRDPREGGSRKNRCQQTLVNV
jgi:hypothetical protein